MEIEAYGWKVLRPSQHVYAFYAGRPDSGLPELEQTTWAQEGALSLGVASYAIVDGDEALVYDSHTSLAHARAVRAELEAAGVRQMTVLLSHWHLDHVAGTEIFGDREILAGNLTAELLAEHRAQIESGTLDGPPAIAPLVLPTRILTGPTTLQVGRLTVEAIPADIHSRDSYLLWLPETRTLLAADAVEDTVTYLDEPDRIEIHLAELERLFALMPDHVLPAHGDPEVISGGGYSAAIITATQEYLRALLRIRTDPTLRAIPLRELLADPLERGWLNYYEPYEQVHTANLTLLG